MAYINASSKEGFLAVIDSIDDTLIFNSRQEMLDLVELLNCRLFSLSSKGIEIDDYTNFARFEYEYITQKNKMILVFYSPSNTYQILLDSKIYLSLDSDLSENSGYYQREGSLPSRLEYTSIVRSGLNYEKFYTAWYKRGFDYDKTLCSYVYYKKINGHTEYTYFQDKEKRISVAVLKIDNDERVSSAKFFFDDVIISIEQIFCVKESIRQLEQKQLENIEQYLNEEEMNLLTIVSF
jgi:hypothetical protein